MLNLKETVGHLSLIEPGNIYSSASIHKIIVAECGKLLKRSYISELLIDEWLILVLIRHKGRKVAQVPNHHQQPRIIRRRFRDSRGRWLISSHRCRQPQLLLRSK